MNKFWLTVLLFCTAAAVLNGCCRKKSPAVMEDNAVLLDVRSAEEFKAGHLPGAVNIPHTEIAEKIISAVPDRTVPLYIYCRSGRRVRIAMKSLRKLQYRNLHDLGGLEDAAEALQLQISAGVPEK